MTTTYNRCVICRTRIPPVPQGICDECKRELRVENRHECFEAESWEFECREAKERREDGRG